MNKLTPRQWALKRYLEDHVVIGQFHSIEELICNVLMPDGSHAYKLNTDPYKHDKCIALSSDIRTINWSTTEGYKIIVKDSRGGAKLCESIEEFESWRNKELKAVEKKYKYLNNLKYKASLDSTVPLLNQALNENDSKPIDVFVGDDK